MRLQSVQATSILRAAAPHPAQHRQQAASGSKTAVWQAGASAVTAALLAASLVHAQPAIAAPADPSDFPRLPAFMQGSFDRFRQQKLEEQARQAQADTAFQESSTLQELLERSRANRQKNLEELQDKYCDRSWLQCLEFMKTMDEAERMDIMGRR